VALDDKQRLEGEIEGHQRRATDAKEKMESSAREFTRKEQALQACPFHQPSTPRPQPYTLNPTPKTMNLKSQLPPKFKR
jgi:hypothetical protein